MEEILGFSKWLGQNSVGILMCSIGLNLLVLILFLTANIKLKKYRNLLKGTEGKDLETLLLGLLEKTDAVYNKQMNIEERFTSNQILEDKHLQNWSLVRFQAFQNTGGDQSFAFAMLDALGDGIVMSSIFGREEARVYCKPIQRGSSNYPLSEEEKEAIQKALGGVKK
jgi:Protein of unknown function (DUF4446)